ncbi:hypothetical protein [Aeromicrobium duanguangcaii]|uniref:Uncharacterized protein n=1 Tax=Aeromicrobium duanguangcaii TaxID=2968086 RepID=A0ABY5KFW2_9ACTN|nr:hypothetical protein [Aeromicrobium duanguangcaii]MCD9155335.1 hypothetical protein [Aeromicrobium duanguangcaii]UUI68017.1 hypothetical protein NP095_12505 [Aeromicrobium duanguangcaii]
MTLRHEPDVSAADWFVRADADWQTLAGQGPPGFEAYATVRFDDGESEHYRSDDELMAIVVALAAQHTRTPEDVFFGLWDGWGELTDQGRVFSVVRSNWLRDLWFRPTPPRNRPAFRAEVTDGPRVDLRGKRAYLLFRGPARDVGDWGAADYAPDVERTLPPASITWPADHAWFIAADVDDDGLCVGGSQRLVDAVLSHPDLAAEPAAYGDVPDSDNEDR